MSAPSLPPGIEGPIQGTLTLCLTEIAWKSTKFDVIFRVRFWGEDSAGILIESPTAFLSYDIRTNFPYFLKYLLDMGSLVIDVLDRQSAVVGQVKVALNSLSKSKSSINFRGKFSVVIKNKPVGMATIVMKSNMKRPEAEVLDSFQQNELKALREAKEASVDKPEESPKRIVVLKRSLNKIPKPKTPVKEEEEAKQKIEERRIEDAGNVIETSSGFDEASGQNERKEEGDRQGQNFSGEFTLNILAFESAYEESDQIIYLETNLYRPVDSEDNEFLPDSFRSSSISKSENTFSFESITFHSLETLNIKGLDLKKLQLEFSLQKLNGEEFISIGEAAVQWVDVLSNDSSRSVFNVPIYEGDINKGSLKIEFSIKIPEIEEPKPSDMLYIYIDHIYRLDGSPSVYIRYKSPVDMQIITTKILWNYIGQPIDHEILLPATEILQKLNRKSLIFEVWEKQQEKDSLLGLGKVSLGDLSPIYPSGIYPTVFFDDYLSIITPAKGFEIGYIKLCLAYGTPLQINRFSKSQKSQIEARAFSSEIFNTRYHPAILEISPKTQNIQDPKLTKQSMKVYSKTLAADMVEVTFLTKNQNIFN